MWEGNSPGNVEKIEGNRRRHCQTKRETKKGGMNGELQFSKTRLQENYLFLKIQKKLKGGCGKRNESNLKSSTKGKYFRTE